MKNILTLSLLLINYIAFAQFTVTKSDGNLINDNDIFIFNTNTYPQANLEFIVTNDNATSDIDVTITVESITNSTGSEMELCFGSCFTGVTQGSSYPNNPAYHLNAGSSSEPHGNHFFNTETSTRVITYVFKFHQVDANGNEIGTPFRMSYRYDANSTASNNEDILNSVSLYPNPAKDQFTIANAEGFNVNIFSILGKEVMTKTAISSNEIVETSNLAEGTYFVKIHSNDSSRTEKLVITK